MAEDVLAVEKLEAGKDYLAALRSLGLEPDVLFWARDAVVGDDVLVLGTWLFDHVGPLALSQVLFQAYNKLATPQAIDPFIVRMCSPQQVGIQQIAGLLGRRFKSPVFVQALDRETRSKVQRNIQISGLDMGNDMNVYTDAIYQFDIARKLAAVEASRKWRRFEGNVDRLAA